MHAYAGSFALLGVFRRFLGLDWRLHPNNAFTPNSAPRRTDNGVGRLDIRVSPGRHSPRSYAISVLASIGVCHAPAWRTPRYAAPPEWIALSSEQAQALGRDALAARSSYVRAPQTPLRLSLPNEHYYDVCPLDIRLRTGRHR